MKYREKKKPQQGCPFPFVGRAVPADNFGTDCRVILVSHLILPDSLLGLPIPVFRAVSLGFVGRTHESADHFPDSEKFGFCKKLPPKRTKPLKITQPGRRAHNPALRTHDWQLPINGNLSVSCHACSFSIFIACAISLLRSFLLFFGNASRISS